MSTRTKLSGTKKTKLAGSRKRKTAKKTVNTMRSKLAGFAGVRNLVIAGAIAATLAVSGYFIFGASALSTSVGAITIPKPGGGFLCLEASVRDYTDGPKMRNGRYAGVVHLWPCNGSVQQKWYTTYYSNGSVRLKTNYKGGLCLDLLYNDRRNGQRIQAWECNQASAQSWHQVGRGSSVIDRIKLYGTNSCLDAAGGKIAQGTRMILWPCHGGAPQRFTIKDGYYRPFSDS